MKTIMHNVQKEIMIKNSKFIGYLFSVSDIEQINDVLEKLKKEHHSATHICFAYRLETREKAHDDGEPTGTAGLPILNVLKSNNLINLLAVSVRYFGGIKLGSGGLIRAYTKSIAEVLKTTDLIDFVKYIDVSISFDYTFTSYIDSILKDSIIKNKYFGELITYNVSINENEYLEISKKLKMYIKK